MVNQSSWLWVFAISLWAPNALAAGPDCQLGERYYDLATKAQNEYREEDAFVFLQRAANACPNYRFFQELAERATEFGDPVKDQAAADAMIQALDLAESDEQRARTTARYAQLLFHNNDPQNAMSYIVQARNLDPNNAWIAELSNEITTRAANVTEQDIKRGLSDMAFKPLKLNRAAPKAEDRTPSASSGANNVPTPTTTPSINIPLNFLVNSTELDAKTQSNLDIVAATLRQDEFEGNRFLLIGHADVRGSAQANLVLSDNRAKAIASEIESRAPTLAGRLTTAGKGEDAPLALGTTEADHAINRRLEIVLLED